MKPLRISQSPLTGRWYAFRAYRQSADGFLVVTGKKEDVTDQINAIIAAATKSPAQEPESA